MNDRKSLGEVQIYGFERVKQGDENGQLNLRLFGQNGDDSNRTITLKMRTSGRDFWKKTAESAEVSHEQVRKQLDEAQAELSRYRLQRLAENGDLTKIRDLIFQLHALVESPSGE